MEIQIFIPQKDADISILRVDQDFLSMREGRFMIAAHESKAIEHTTDDDDGVTYHCFTGTKEVVTEFLYEALKIEMW